MPDVCMCNGVKNVNESIVECPKKHRCYRHTATPNEYRQSWFMQAPIDVIILECDDFWDNSVYTEYRSGKK